MKTAINIACVVVIVLIVGAILFPIFAQTKDGEHSPCFSYMKRTSTAMQIYAEDFDDRLMPRGDWMTILLPYCKTETIFHCPVLSAENKNWYGYALMADLAGEKIGKVKKPDEKVLLFETGILVRGVVSTLATVAVPGRHGGGNGNNVVFLDGHAKFMRNLESGK